VDVEGVALEEHAGRRLVKGERILAQELAPLLRLSEEGRIVEWDREESRWGPQGAAADPEALEEPRPHFREEARAQEGQAIDQTGVPILEADAEFASPGDGAHDARLVRG